MTSSQNIEDVDRLIAEGEKLAESPESLFSGYQEWYSEALGLVQTFLATSRAADFMSFYRGIDKGQNKMAGIEFFLRLGEKGFNEQISNNGLPLDLFRQQLSILRSVKRQIEQLERMAQ